MSDVLLRECVEEMRDKLHAGKYSDVLALGRHILHFYPKHIETYTLLGQASLETNDVPGATDLYRRVLSADPENVLALAGMALLAESQDKYDDALWYLERAYEIQPSNDELRRELMRVREADYGTTSARLELTPGALARVYARQGQYSHAVNEFRRLLKNESQRYDARVALAETLYRAGRNDEAAQLAQQVMADAPYSLKPNLILGALWSENAVPEGERFLQRAAALDPENRVAVDLLGERFAAPAVPSLPRPGETMPPETDATQITTADEEGVRIAHLMQEIEREQAAEAEYAATAELFAEQDAQAAEESSKAGVADKVAAEQVSEQDTGMRAAGVAALGLGALAAAEKREEKEEIVPADMTIEPAAVAEVGATDQKETAEISAPVIATETTTVDAKPRAGKPVPTDAIAAAAAALAASIVLDKNNQPSPTRRANPAIPKVRPVIRSAQDKLPAWLRLGTTPSAASASFDTPSPSDADQIAPMSAAALGGVTDDRPEWLVQAQAAAEDSTDAQTGSELPDWLGAAPVIAAAAVATSESAEAKPTVAAKTETALPAWLQDAQPTDISQDAGVSKVAVAVAAGAVEMPSWLSDKEVAEATAVPAISDEVRTGTTNNLPAEPVDTTGAVHVAATTVPMVSRMEEADAAQGQVTHEAPSAIAGTNEPTDATGETETTEAQAQPEESAERPAPPAQALPDPATMLAMAREKRADGDLKGALDVYERLMHRRPNHLEEVIGDLKEMVSDEGAPSSSHRLLGEAFAMAGRFKESLEQYRIAMGK